MYEEFIIGYVLSGTAVILLVLVIVLQCKILKKLSRGGSNYQKPSYVSHGVGNVNKGYGMAICRKCATQFDAVHTVCPKCGTPR